MKLGVSTTPAVYVRDVSGTSLGLPWEMTCTPPGLKLVRGSRKGPLAEIVGEYRSFSVGARISTDVVPRKRTLSFTCQSRPIFQVCAAPEMRMRQNQLLPPTSCASPALPLTCWHVAWR